METLTRLVSESLARHGFDRPVDYRRLQWSRWFRCESHHSLLVVPSKPGVFALAEEVMSLGTPTSGEGRDSSRAEEPAPPDAAAVAIGRTNPKPEAQARMLAVTQFFEDDDMAFVLDRMLSRQNPLRERLASGRCFVRFVEIKDQAQRRSICNTLNQWIVSSAEKATGIGSQFGTSREVASGTERTPVATAAEAFLNNTGALHVSPLFRDVGFSTDGNRRDLPATPSEAAGSACDAGEAARNPKQNDEVRPTTAPRLNSAVDTTIHCSSSFPAGF